MTNTLIDLQLDCQEELIDSWRGEKALIQKKSFFIAKPQQFCVTYETSLSV